ncbi:hypothetical protein [Mesorhizobium sp.]|uniref:hypothetical protein n=1 Tax=Mesorhizobium sp. TaxID=1871066 RepID=UPI000FE48A9E|nr:hypothetical protein [Mesorhizobium sp.]RWP73215.1 MAG: hypothetical protein EOR09_19490 [Mesorhizobium sp.]
MQFDLLRAFPYPVLRPGVDDYRDSDIQATVDFQQSADSATVTAEVDFALSVAEIKALVDQGKADYVVVFACRDTYFRKASISKQPTFTETFSAGELRGEVLVYPYIIASSHIDSFQCPWINAEFGPGPFEFPNGAVLALDQPQSIYIDRDAFKPISSCFLLVKSDSVPDNEWQVRADSEKVQIAVSPSLKARIDVARNTKENRAILINSVYFGAVMQCLSLLKQGEDHNDFRWANIFRQRMIDQSIDLDKHHEAWIAQQLMRHPISIIDSYFFGDKGNE